LGAVHSSCTLHIASRESPRKVEGERFCTACHSEWGTRPNKKSNCARCQREGKCSKVYVVDHHRTELRTKAPGNDDNMQRSNWSPSGHLSFSIIDKPQKLYSWGGWPVVGSLCMCYFYTLHYWKNGGSLVCVCGL